MSGAVEIKCRWCGKPGPEIRANNSCGVCRSLDRVRGLCNRLPITASPAVLGKLKELESTLRDWLPFGGPPDDFEQKRELSPEPVSLAQALKATPKSASHSTAEPASSDPPFESGGHGRKRKKKNKGRSRQSWKAARDAIALSRSELADPTAEDREFTSDSELD